MRANRGVRAGAWVAVCIGSVVLCGWITGSPQLTTFLPGGRSTRPESALAFLLLAGALLQATTGASAAGRAALRRARGLALLSGLIALEALALHMGAPLGWLHARLLTWSGHPAVISVPNALATGAVALAVLLARSPSRWSRRCFDLAVLTGVSIGAVATLAAFFGWYETRPLSVLHATALPSGLALLALGAGTAFLRPEGPFASAVLDPGPGGMLLRRLLPACIIVPCASAFAQRFVALPGWLEELGSAPFILADVAIFAALITQSANVVRRVIAQRDRATHSLAEQENKYAALLQERELRFRLLAEASPQIVWTASADGDIEYLSPEWVRFCGCPEEEGMGWTWRKHVHPGDRVRLEQAWRTAVEHGTAYESEYRLRRHDGCYRWLLSRASPVRDERGRITRWYGADTDVHELREAREALRLSEARFRVTLQHQDFIVWTQDASLRYTWVYNPAPGFEEDRSLGVTDRDILGAEASEHLVAIKQRVLETGEPFAGEVPVQIQGEQRHYEMRLHALTDVEGEVIGLAGAAYDITSHLRSEQALRRTQRLESIGLLAGGVAHDFNNLLTAIIGNATCALDALPEGQAAPRLEGMLRSIVSAGESAAVLTRQLLAYAGKGRFVVAPVDLGELRDSLKPLLRASVPRSIAFEFDVAPGVPRVEADIHQMQQLLTNLVLNAVEAIGDVAGNVTVALRSVQLDDKELKVLGLPLEGPRNYVKLTVEDDGPGMAQATLERAFEPFFSTKFAGRGLGLSAVQGIVRAHHGAIHAESVEGEGTEVSVYLPAMAIVSEERALAPPPRTDSGTERLDLLGATVLFVDDEALLRELAAAALGGAGYRVLLAQHGAEALELVGAPGSKIDVVVLDLTMPVLGGVETARRLHEMQVQIPIIASSGYSETETLERFGSRAIKVLRKPYRPADLVDMVSDTLRARSGPQQGVAASKSSAAAR